MDYPTNLYNHVYGDDVPDYIDVTYTVRNDGTSEWYTEYAQPELRDQLDLVTKVSNKFETIYGTVVFANNQPQALEKSYGLIMDFIENERILEEMNLNPSTRLFVSGDILNVAKELAAYDDSPYKEVKEIKNIKKLGKVHVSDIQVNHNQLSFKVIAIIEEKIND